VAVEAASALASIAERYRSRALAADAALARARASLLAGDADTAIERASDAVAIWIDLGAPFEAASARLVLGEALRCAGNSDAARMEWNAARAGFEAYGAAGKVSETEALIQGAHRLATPAVPVASHRIATPVEKATFTSDGALRTVTFAGTTVVLRDLTGMRYLARLLADPGREFHVLDLVAVERGTLPTGDNHRDSELHPSDGGLPLIDERARAAYQQRLVEVDDDIEEARAMHDLARLEQAEHDREYLIAELSRAVGLGGRLRRSGSDAERARTSVARSLRYALDQLAREHPLAAAHLRHALSTGTYCSYAPDPVAAVSWET
jgi:tetratricopeptide (TPR) repeat protein